MLDEELAVLLRDDNEVTQETPVTGIAGLPTDALALFSSTVTTLAFFSFSRTARSWKRPGESNHELGLSSSVDMALS